MDTPLSVSGVEKILLPASLSRLNQYAFAFYDFTNLKEIWNYAATPLDLNAQGISDVSALWYNLYTDTDPANIKLYVPAGSVDAYKAAEVWKEFDVQPMSNVPTAISNVQSDKVQCTKTLRNGQLLIEKNGQIYTVDGRLVR